MTVSRSKDIIFHWLYTVWGRLEVCCGSICHVFVWESLLFTKETYDVVPEAFIADDLFHFDNEVLFRRRYPWLPTLAIWEKLKVRIDISFDSNDMECRMSL
jgi:hypothetical protein